MRSDYPGRVVLLCGLAAAVAGVLLTVRTVGILADAAGRFDGKQADLARLSELHGELEEYNAARRAFEDLGEARPESVEAVLRAVLPNRKTEDVRELRRTPVDGWTLVEKELVLPAMPIGEVVAFAGRLECGRPPWRVTGCDIRSTGRVPGAARVVLRLEGLARQPGAG